MTTEHRIIIASAEVQAASKADENGGVAFRGTAYSGGILRVPGYRDGVVLDLAGLTIPDSIPLSTDHSTSLDARLGTAQARIVGSELHVFGSIVPGTPAADRAIALIRAGGVSLSIGATPSKILRLREGETTEVNGQAFRGPLELASESQLAEISAVGVGADRGAVAIAARRNSTKKAGIMETGTGTDPILIERDRIVQIRAAFRGIDNSEDRVNELIDAGADLAEARATALSMLRAQRAGAGITTVRSGNGHLDEDVQSAALVLALAGQGVAERNFSAPIMERAADLHRREPSFLGKIGAIMQIAGVQVPHDRSEMIRAAFSTSALSGLLSTSIRTIALDSFRSTPEPWRRIAKRVPLSDFKLTDVARLAGNFAFENLAPQGELKHAVLDGHFTAMKLGTTGKVVMIDRRDIINDSAGLLEQIPMELGKEAARRVGDDFAAALVAGDSGASGFFSIENSNIIGGPLLFASLTEAVAALRTQTDSSGRVLNLAPAVLLVAADVEMMARQLLNSSDVGRTDGGPSGNPLESIASVEVDGRLANGSWYLFARPSDAAAVVGTLNGADAPIVEAVDPGPGQLGAGWRGYFDHAVALHEHRAAVQGHASIP